MGDRTRNTHKHSMTTLTPSTFATEKPRKTPDQDRHFLFGPTGSEERKRKIYLELSELCFAHSYKGEKIKIPQGIRKKISI